MSYRADRAGRAGRADRVDDGPVTTAPTTPTAPTVPTTCPCQSGMPYQDCCRPFHLGEGTAPTAERLMRSRYCGFALQDEAYLLKTWHPSTRPLSVALDRGMRWHQLQILGRTGGGLLDRSGTVEFLAAYRRAGVAGEHHENSRFVRERGCWLYVGLA